MFSVVWIYQIYFNTHTEVNIPLDNLYHVKISFIKDFPFECTKGILFDVKKIYPYAKTLKSGMVEL